MSAKSSTRDHYISLTAHASTVSDEIKPVSVLSSFRRLTSQKLSKNLNEFIAYKLDRLGLKDCVHTGIAAENASDIKTAIEPVDFSPRFPCIAHVLYLITNHSLRIWDESNADM